MQLRARFALTLIAAAVLPTAIAAAVVVNAVAADLRAEQRRARTDAARLVDRELERLTASVAEASAAIAASDHPLSAAIVADLRDDEAARSTDARRRWRQMAEPTMRGAHLDLLTITGPHDIVLVAPHDRGKVGDADPTPRQRAAATGGKPFFTRDTIATGHAVDTVLVVESATLADDAGVAVTVVAGRRVTSDLVALIRRPPVVDARLTMASGEVVVPSSVGAAEWPRVAGDSLARTALPGPDGAPMAYLEVAVAVPGLDEVLAKFAPPALLAALATLVAVVVIGLWVMRRTTRDLELLASGATAAARGDFNHRVAVRSNDEVGAVGKAFNFMMEDLQVANERLVIAERIAAWQDIARRLAHEIKNPLTPIQMAMDTLRKAWSKQHPTFGEILDESTTTVLEEADRLKRIVAEFSDFARMPKPVFARMNLGDVVRSTLALYKEAPPTVEAVLDPALPDLIADKDQVGQVLLNLVENARDALGPQPDGRIAISTRRGDTPDRVILVVEDNGPGVPFELRDKVFTPYFTTKTAKGGTGLGLAIVHRIVSDHGGRIAISSSADGGARIAIEWPLRGGVALLASRT